MASKRAFVPALEAERSPGGTLRADEEEAVLLEHTPSESHLRIWKPPVTPDVSSPSTSAQVLPGTSGAARPSKTAKRSLGLDDKAIANLLMDSGSDGDDDDDDLDDDDWWSQDVRTQRALYKLVREQEAEDLKAGTERQVEAQAAGPGHGEFEGLIAIGQPPVRDEVIDKVLARERIVTFENQAGLEQPTLAQVYEGLDVFSWSEDFSTFTGQEETHLRIPGPTAGSQDPVDIFTQIWDNSILEKIVAETNKYAWYTIATLSEVENGIPQYLMEWKDTTVEELYSYFSVVMFMTLCYRTRVSDYWTTGVLGMPDFRKIMSKDRYLLLTKFLHFVDNDEMDPRISTYEKKIFKIRPILDHLNKKFVELYVPNKHLSLDESLLLWKGRLSWVQAARFGVKSYELCEAVTGYQLRCLLYAGKDSTMSEEPIHGFESCTAKVVLGLMDRFLDIGHLVMDNWYNQLPMTRFLKRKTVVIGPMNPRRLHVPDDITRPKETRMARTEEIARHCSDISQPKAIAHYNKYMGGVDSKDQKLSMYLMERKRVKKWYIKVFRRLLNTSILNAFIIFSKNPITKKVKHRDFRECLALGLAKKYGLPEAPAPSVSENVFNEVERRLQIDSPHFIEYTENLPGKNKPSQLRCVRCTAAGRRTMTTFRCSFCCVPLCVGSCWAEYHTLKNLKSSV